MIFQLSLTPSTYAEPTTAEPSTAESSTEATKATEETQESTKDTIAPVTSQDATSVTQPVTKKIRLNIRHSGYI